MQLPAFARFGLERIAAWALRWLVHQRHLQVAEHFQTGVSHGLRTKWYPNGVKLSEGEIVDGKFQGTFRRWDETGSLAEQVEFAEGQPHGLSLAYYPSGFLKTRVTMHQGKVLERDSWSDGETKDPLVAAVV